MPKKVYTCGKPHPQALGKAMNFPLPLAVPSFIHFLVHSINKYWSSHCPTPGEECESKGLIRGF